MVSNGEACSHIASLLFTVEANTQMKQQFSCTSLLPHSWLPSSFRSVPFYEICKINFSTPQHKRMQCQHSFITEGKPVRKIKKLSIPKATDGDLDIFFSNLFIVQFIMNFLNFCSIYFVN